MVVLDHDEEEFGFSDGDRIIIDQSVKDIHSQDHILFLIETSDGPAVLRREPNVGGARKGEVVLTNGRGVSQAIRETTFKVLGAVNGVLSSGVAPPSLAFSPCRQDSSPIAEVHPEPVAAMRRASSYLPSVSETNHSRLRQTAVDSQPKQFRFPQKRVVASPESCRP
jgi:hypothetical protein